MTIHTKWMELLRSEASDAFRHELGTGVVEASFIDGQIKLMKGDSIQTWYAHPLSQPQPLYYHYLPPS